MMEFNDPEYLGDTKPVNQIDPVISVAIITYQHEPYIKQCLDSVLNQEVSVPIEILIGEDHSKDRTREICKRYADKHPDKIRLFLRSRENMISVDGHATGHYNAMATFAAARGKYIAFVEGDDFWLGTNKLQRQLDHMVAHPECTCCAHTVYHADPDGPRLGDRRVTREGNGNIPINDLIIGGPNSLATASLFIRRSVFNLPAWYPTAHVGDYYIRILLADQGDIYYMDDPMACYRINVSASATSTLHDHESIHFYRQLFNKYEMLNRFNKTTQNRHLKVVQRAQGNALRYALHTSWKQSVSMRWYIYRASTKYMSLCHRLLFLFSAMPLSWTCRGLIRRAMRRPAWPTIPETK